MKFVFAALVPALFALNAQGDAPKSRMSCQAIYRTLDKNNQSVEKRAELKFALATPDFLKLEADLEGKNFSLLEDRTNADLFAQITTGPNYTKGTVLRGQADSLGRFNATEVDGATVYRLECGKAAN